MLTEATEEVVATTEGLAEIARTQLLLALEGTEPGVSAVLRDALTGGQVRGSRLWCDGVGCVLGWIAFAEGAEYPAWAAMDRSVSSTYALEEWAAPIRVDDFPDHTAHEDSGAFRAAVLVSWIDEFERERVAA